jgi:hypothetical protein
MNKKIVFTSRKFWAQFPVLFSKVGGGHIQPPPFLIVYSINKLFSPLKGQSHETVCEIMTFK